MYRYPDIDDPGLVSALYRKREFYDHRARHFESFATDEARVAFVRRECQATDREIQHHQALLRNLVNPRTPYRGLIVYHGLGSGKTFAALAVAETFKAQVERYETKIWVVVPGKDVRSNWENDMVKKWGERSALELRDLSRESGSGVVRRHAQQVKRHIRQFVQFVTFDKLRKLVLGERVKDRTGRKVYRLGRNAVAKLDNSLIIVDEAHGIAGSERGVALRTLIHNSTNLRVLLLSATPMRNVAEDVVPLLNLLRPADQPLAQDDVFETGPRVLDTVLRPGGLDVLRNAARGYVSYFRQAHPLLYPEVREQGSPVPGLDMRLVRCEMRSLQRRAYDAAVAAVGTDNAKSLDGMARLQALSNFAVPLLADDGTTVTAASSHAAVAQFRSQYRQQAAKYRSAVGAALGLRNPVVEVTATHRTVGGDLLRLPALRALSCKYAALLEHLLAMGPGTAFIYSNLVEMGIQVLEEVLLANGYGRYGSKVPLRNARCATCGRPGSDAHGGHVFRPATFASFTGQSSDDAASRDTIIPLFSGAGNLGGGTIKFLLGSQVLSEGVNLYNVRDVHIMDAHMNISRINQAIGRAVRWCGHVNRLEDGAPIPAVRLYRYAASLAPDAPTLSSEEKTYRHAEVKAMLIGDVERALQEVAVDCPLNYQANGVVCDGAEDLFDGASGYATLADDQMDTKTFRADLAEKQTRRYVIAVKRLFRRRVSYTLPEVRSLLDVPKGDLFFLYRAVEHLCPTTDAQKSRFTEVLYDSYDRLGYLIYRDPYFIFQQWTEDERAPMYYREMPPPVTQPRTSLAQFLRHRGLLPDDSYRKRRTSALDATLAYYQRFDEGDYVGVLDRKTPAAKDFVFRIREKQADTDYRRGKGVVSYRGAVCATKPLPWLRAAAAHLGLTLTQPRDRAVVCAELQAHLRHLHETTDKTYLILPGDHPDFPIPKATAKATAKA
jgi:hypothetical protein